MERLDAPVVYVPGVFDPDLVSRLIAAFDADGGRESGQVEAGGEVVKAFDPTVRHRLDAYIRDKDLVERISRAISAAVLPKLREVYQYEATRVERHLVGCYDASCGSHFSAHRDNVARPVVHRKFALSIGLNDGYEGGDLRFPEYSDRLFRPGPGDALVFSCSLLHEVLPVTAGRRYVYLTFLYDEAGEQLRDAYRRSLTTP